MAYTSERDRRRQPGTGRLLTARPIAGALRLIAVAALAAAIGGIPVAGKAAPDRTSPKVLVLGLDGMDPVFLREFVDEGVMPTFARMMASGHFSELGTAIPPQSPVAWSNFITGQDAGGHGIFDFIHRDPKTMLPFLSTSEAQQPTKWWKLGGWKLPRDGGGVELLRHGRAFWELLTQAGVDVTVFKIPANFPPVGQKARTLSGMGTPDILGTYGIFSYVTDHPPADTDISGGRIVPIDFTDGHAEARIPGPVNTYRKGDPETGAIVQIDADPVHPAALFQVGDERFLLQEGEWSRWIDLSYDMLPLGLKSVSGICRFYLMEVRPHFRLYVTPVQIDPRDPEMQISTPADYSRDLAEAIGPYYTQGLPDDTKALEEQVFDDDDAVAQSDLVFDERVAQLRYELAHFKELDSGLLFFYFNSPDQTCHMFWRNMDIHSPMHADAHGMHKDRIREVYRRLDGVLEMTLSEVGDQTTVIVLSDHGFAPYNRSFHVNRWLLDEGYLALKPGVTADQVSYLQGIDWSRTRAYAIGINGLYLNLRGREKHGIVSPGGEQEALLAELVAKLEAVVDDSTGQRAIKHAYRADRIYHGPYAATGPDIVLGYYRGFRGSNESALGEIPADVFDDNMLKWSGDHCMAADEVPGILLSNRPITKKEPELLDMAPTLLALFGLPPTPEMRGSDIFAPSGEGVAAGGPAAGGPAADHLTMKGAE
jgi:predicted AlkP superfamily phosphohydrolase/phosphomutase